MLQGNCLTVSSNFQFATLEAIYNCNTMKSSDIKSVRERVLTKTIIVKVKGIESDESSFNFVKLSRPDSVVFEMHRFAAISTVFCIYNFLVLGTTWFLC